MAKNANSWMHSSECRYNILTVSHSSINDFGRSIDEYKANREGITAVLSDNGTRWKFSIIKKNGDLEKFRM